MPPTKPNTKINNKPVSVLFVCLGNICRSPMAEATFKHIVAERKLDAHFSCIDSAGTGPYHIGELPDRRSTDTCHKNGVTVNHKGRQLTLADFEKFDWILCMDDANVSNVKSMMPSGCKTQVQLLGFFDPHKTLSNDGHIIIDPYYGEMDGFQLNFEQCRRATNGFLKHLGMETAAH
ncbi:hypothetical protein BATDEDRAFT_85660 [Batrachochytrium dendrobatidis JAM81]|uniref:Phosphotyrosine protein phosphatase I domain-containing protein n=2 Tax=Batrachochytrium dendrobatidis TaxID=109871 RepID=F4NRD5_BATDJ|nr:tyrosine protein phosphatase LTP1 [Batrachochytrium dendrobatidis JAM81]EGF82932.1 hypothetical protein BATDEDRAFT_85660 [Batrachochytrium dendrobatidis JAM81]KAJ8331757.1 Low molecular weight phosphotyrosine protein phosphatase [Batrachochytrium dendrobatidis]OAJ35808.1 hypothetical protein BDEG_20043 [Batrachochytrium dendrobatidis JEL423]|eukprot:XP_006675914.1 hypothetical protein BATDEDRAFT_85660 [Batrachochytrium dendrobatidis JAM81]